MTIRTDISETNKPLKVEGHRSTMPAKVPTIDVTAEYQGKIGSYDIRHLDTESFNRLLRSKGGRNDLAEDILRKIYGHPPQRPE